MMRPMVVWMRSTGLHVLVLAERVGHAGVLAQAHLDLGLQVHVGASVIGVAGIGEVDERAALAREAIAGCRQVVRSR